ncbi:MAG: aldehyde dehydrogenase family protein [Acidimicrobiales bacterium]
MSRARRVSSVVGGRIDHDAPGGTVQSRNPARLEEVVAEVALGDAGTFAAACSVAKEAQVAWAAVPAPVRGRAIAQVGRLVEANASSLARLVVAEVGKPYAEALGEVREIVDTCDFFLSEGRRLYGQTVPSEMPDKALFTFRNPLGVVAVVTAGNFPVAVPSWYVVPALLCGNTVVWKPAEHAAATAAALAELLWRGGIPAGALSLVLADGAATFGGLERGLDEGTVDKVGFTGSSAVGELIGALCGRHLQSPCLELGGKNPLVVMADARLELAVEGALFSAFATAGQRCTSLGTVLVQESVHDRFLEAFAAATEQAAVGDPTREVLYGPLMSERFASGFEEHLALVGEHHRVLGSSGRGRIGPGNPRAGFVGEAAGGLYYHPSIVDGLRREDRLFSEETFGPIVGVCTFGDLDEAVELANAPRYGLSASVYTASAQSAFEFGRRVSAGMVSVNNSTSGAEAHLPFGGNGRSGNGSRQSGIWVLEQLTRWQAMNWDYSGRLQKAQMDVSELTADPDFRLEEPPPPSPGN